MMKKLMSFIAAAALMLGCSAFAALEDMVLLYDTYVDADNPDAGYSGLDNLRLQGEGQAIDNSGPFPVLVDYPMQRVFLQFDISSVPVGATLTNAEFGIYLNEAYQFDSPKLQLWLVNNDNWDNTLTWNSSLAVLGAEAKIGLVQSAGAADEYWKWTWSDLSSWDYADALVAGKVSLMLTMDPENEFNFAVFNSGENDAFHPYLKLDYIIPEPATLSLLALGMGSLTMVRRKR